MAAAGAAREAIASRCGFCRASNTQRSEHPVAANLHPPSPAHSQPRPRRRRRLRARLRPHGSAKRGLRDSEHSQWPRRRAASHAHGLAQMHSTGRSRRCSSRGARVCTGHRNSVAQCTRTAAQRGHERHRQDSSTAPRMQKQDWLSHEQQRRTVWKAHASDDRVIADRNSKA